MCIFDLQHRMFYPTTYFTMKIYLLRTSFLLVLMTTSFTLSAQLNDLSSLQTILVKAGGTYDTTEVLLTGTDVESFVYHSFLNTDWFHPYLSNLQFFNSGNNHWYLVGWSEPESQYYAFTLIKLGSGLYLSGKKLMHTCPCEKTDSPEEVFVLEKEKISHCVNMGSSFSMGSLSIFGISLF